MRYLEIIELLMSDPPNGVGGKAWTAAELISETGMSASTLYTYLNKMLMGGFVEKRGTLYNVADWFVELAVSHGGK